MSEQLSPPPKRWRLRTRLALAMAAVVLPLLIVVTASHRESMAERREAQVDNSVLVARTVAGVVDGFVRDMESFSLAAAIALGAQQRPFTDPITFAYLNELNSSYELVRSVFVTDVGGRVVATRDGTNLGFDLSQRAYIRELQAGKESTWSEGLAGAETGLTTVAHSRVIRGLDDQIRGFLVVAFYPERLTQRLPPDIPAAANVTFIDATGRLLFSSQSSGSVGPQERIPPFPALERAMAGHVGRVESERTPLVENKRYGAFVPIPANGWVVGYTLPQGALESSLQARFYRDVGVTSMALLVGVGVMFVVAELISRPLTSLAGAAAAIARGERPLVPTASAPQEVVQLEQAMSTMSRAVARREELLREQARILLILERVGATVASELDYQKAAQAITDAATELTGAEFGAFFFNDSPEGEPPFTASGADPGRIASMALLQWVASAGQDKAVVRVDDIDALRSRKNGRAKSGVRSFLSVQVKSRFGEPLGVLVFGHPQPGVFAGLQEQLALGIARWASISMDNARLYREAWEAQEQLRHSNRAKDEFIGIVSHELRTPITTIYGTARLLETRKGRLNPDVEAELMANLTLEAERMHRLIEDLLAVARLELGPDTMTEPLLLGSLVERVCQQFMAQRPGRKVVWRTEEGLAPVLGEATYIEQVLTNLLTNADKYTEDGSPVEVDVASVDDEAVVTVSDRGPGVQPEELPLIFDSFYRSDRTARRAGGKGLGLTVCKRLIEAQGGRIWAEPRPGGGLQVSFSLKLALTAEEAESVEAL